MTQAQYKKLNKEEKVAYLEEISIEANIELTHKELDELFPKPEVKEHKKTEGTIEVDIHRHNRARAISLEDGETPDILVKEIHLGINWTFAYDKEIGQYSLVHTTHITGVEAKTLEKAIIKSKGIQKSHNLLTVEVLYA